MNIQHSSRNDAWRTPEHILEAVRKVIGVIDLDPASSEQANKTIKAEHILTAQDDALIEDWPWHESPMSVYLNPPGGKFKGKSMTKLFWSRLMQYRDDGFLRHAIFAFFSVEGLQNTQSETPCAMDFPLCIPAKRVRWEHPTDKGKNSPSHSNAFIYVPGTRNDTNHFIEVFSELGKCKK